jgi:hypothetical protein
MPRMRSKSVWSCAVVLASAASAGATPAWCKEKTSFNDEDATTLRTGDPDEIVRRLAQAQCAPASEVDSHKAEIQKGLAEWGAKFGLKDADWADVLAWPATRSITTTR